MACSPLNRAKTELYSLEDKFDTLISEYDSYLKQNPLFTLCPDARSLFVDRLEQLLQQRGIPIEPLQAKVKEYMQKEQYFLEKIKNLMDKLGALNSQLQESEEYNSEITAISTRISSKTVVLLQPIVGISKV